MTEMDSCLAEKIFAFAPIFDPREKNRASQEAVYARHRERIINAKPVVDTTPPLCMLRTRIKNYVLSAESSRLGDIEIENEALMSRIATAMVNPSQIDCHNDYAKRPSLLRNKWEKDRLEITYANFATLTRMGKRDSVYQRRKFLEEWEAREKQIALQSLYKHDWIDPIFTPAILHQKFRRTKSAPVGPFFRDVEIVHHRCSKKLDLETDLRLKDKAIRKQKKLLPEL